MKLTIQVHTQFITNHNIPLRDILGALIRTAGDRIEEMPEVDKEIITWRGIPIGSWEFKDVPPVETN